MLELRPGVSPSLVMTAIGVFNEMEKYKERVPLDPTARLLKMPWCLGIYDGQECVAAIWGSDEINVVCRPSHRGKIFTRRLVREFFTFFFARYGLGKVAKNEYTDLWLRLGFKPEDDCLVITPQALRI